jgi:hypothetical protein
VPGVLVGDALVGGDEGRPVLPPVVAGEGLACGRGAGELYASELRTTAVSYLLDLWSRIKTYRSL